MAMKLISGAAAIDKAIASISSRGAKLDGDIQVAACSVLKHIDECGDYTLAERLVLAMPKGSRKLALVEFLLAFGKVRVLDKNLPDDQARILAGGVFAFAKDKATDMEGAVSTPWFEFKKEVPVLEAFDAQAAIVALLKKIKGMQAKGVRVEHADLIEGMAKLVQA